MFLPSRARPRRRTLSTSVFRMMIVVSFYIARGVDETFITTPLAHNEKYNQFTKTKHKQSDRIFNMIFLHVFFET
jgi:hypothetical protein